MHKSIGRLVLGLEAGIDGGSLSILEDDLTIDSVSGSGNLSKSEDLLFLLEGLLEKNSIGKREIGLIAVSDEPGSLTGVRIGLSIAKGLGAALSVPVRKISILDALASLCEAEGSIISAVLNEHGGVFYKKYFLWENTLQIEQETSSKRMLAEFRAELDGVREKDGNMGLVFSKDSEKRLSRGPEGESFGECINLYPVGGSLSEILGRALTTRTRLITKESAGFDKNGKV